MVFQNNFFDFIQIHSEKFLAWIDTVNALCIEVLMKYRFQGRSVIGKNQRVNVKGERNGGTA